MATAVPEPIGPPVVVPAPMPVVPPVARPLARPPVKPSISTWVWWQASVPLPRLLLAGMGVAVVLVVSIAYAAGVVRGETYAGERQEGVSDARPGGRAPAKPGPMREDFGKLNTASEDAGDGRGAVKQSETPATPPAEKKEPKTEAPAKATPPTNQPVGWRVVSYDGSADHEPKIRAMVAHINSYMRSGGVAATWFRLNDRAEQIVAVTFDPALAADEKHRSEVFERLKALPPLKNRDARFDFAKELKPYLVYGAVR